MAIIKDIGNIDGMNDEEDGPVQVELKKSSRVGLLDDAADELEAAETEKDGQLLEVPLDDNLNALT